MKRRKTIFMIMAFLSIFHINSLDAQKTRKTAKFHMGIETSIGNTFPNFITPQEKWKATIYGAWSTTLSVMMRFNQNWSGDLGIGLSGYAMVNRSDSDRYNLDFFSPYLIGGIQYSHPIRTNAEAFYGVSIGIQQGYKGEFIEYFNTYSVRASSDNSGYTFGKLQMGMRKEMKKKRKKIPLSYEYGTYFRYNFNSLGTAEFIHQDNYVEILQPKGHILGIFFKLLVPTSTTKVRLRNKVKDLPPVIFHPRM